MTYRPKDTKERITHRLKIARGHLEKVIRMVETDEYCIDILHQSQAVQKALKETNSLILENHLQTCVKDYFKDHQQQQAVAELVQILRKGVT